MSDEPLEAALRQALRRAAPLAVPSELEHTVLAIPSQRNRIRWLGSSSLPVIVLLVISTSAALLLAAGELRVVPPKSNDRLVVSSPFGTLAAEDLKLSINGRSIDAPAVGDLGTHVTFTGSDAYGRLEITWMASGRTSLILLHFSADANSWWISDGLIGVGGSDPAFVYFRGPALQTPRQGEYAGSPDLEFIGLTGGTTGFMRLSGLRLYPFAETSGRALASGTMPPSGIIGPKGPDYVPVAAVAGGYVSSHRQDDLGIIGLLGQPPGEPVFGSDLKTIIGYLVPGGTFQPN